MSHDIYSDTMTDLPVCPSLFLYKFLYSKAVHLLHFVYTRVGILLTCGKHLQSGDLAAKNWFNPTTFFY
jgi:hypothetical protein